MSKQLYRVEYRRARAGEYVMRECNATESEHREDVLVPCTELYTEREVRERVAKAYADAGEGLVFAWAAAYLETPTDSNWARLMAEVGAGGAT